jgi:AcrR family transcriptional regulator
MSEAHSAGRKIQVAEKTPEGTSSKRDAILEAARTLFAKKRYEETTIADIARAAGVAVGTVYLYFHNKHEVYTAVALDTEAMVARAFHSPEVVNQPFEQALRTMVDDLFRISREHMHLMGLLQIDMQSSEEVIQHKHAHEDLTQVLATIFQRAIDRGDLAPFDTEMYAMMLILLGSNLLHHCFAIEKGERETLYRQSFIELLERLFFGPSLHQGYPDHEH